MSRFDRASGRKAGWGGIAVFASDANIVSHLHDSTLAERFWHTVHTDIGPILLGNWYRAPDAGLEAIESLATELESFGDQWVGTVILGDMNVHHARWLRFSNGNTALGAKLKQTCDDFGLVQCVDKATRGNYLLDLVLTDCAALSSTNVAPEIADHRVVLFDLAVATPTFAPVERFVWAFPRAKWSSLRAALASTDWAPIIDGPSVDSAVASFTDHLFHIAQAHIPYRKCSMRKSTHPWLNDRCAAAVARKCATAGTPDFGAAQKECNAILSEEYRSHVNRLRHKLSTLPRGPQCWWKFNRELLNKKANPVKSES